MKPTLEEVKEHFKDAKKVKCLYDNEEFNIENLLHFALSCSDGIIFKKDNDKYRLLYSLDSGYAEITEYKSDKPDHYETDSIDVIDFCKIYDLNFNMGNIIKYACRKKDQDIEDLKKIIDYAQRELKHLDK